MASGMTGGGGSQEGEEGDSEDGEGGEEPSGSPKYSIARRVNARRPSTTAAEATERPKPQERLVWNHAASLSSLTGAAAPAPGGRQARQLSEHRMPSSFGCRRGTVSAAEGIAADDFLPDTRAGATAAATMTAAKSPRTSGHAAVPVPTAPSSRSLRPLLDADGVPSGLLPAQLGTTATDADGASATMFGHGGTAMRHPQPRRRYSSLSFAENPHATTAEMIRRYRGLIRRHSMPSRRSGAAQLAGNTPSPPLATGRRRSSESNTRWHYYVSANSAGRSGSSVSRPRTSVGGSRWSQDVRFLEHMRGRSRLAPATRTAGGRWGANHGRLEALIPGEEMEPPRASIIYRIPRESGPWVLDTNHPGIRENHLPYL